RETNGSRPPTSTGNSTPSTMPKQRIFLGAERSIHPAQEGNADVLAQVGRSGSALRPRETLAPFRTAYLAARGAASAILCARAASSASPATAGPCAHLPNSQFVSCLSIFGIRCEAPGNV